MPVTKTWAGGTFNLPLNREPKGSWGTEVSNFLISLANNALALTGGTQTLSAEMNFGATYGLVSAYVKSASANIASSGMLRLAKGDSVAWRNNANGADLSLGVNASDRLAFGGVAIPTISSTDALTSKTIVVASNTVTTAASGNLAATELNAALSELQSDIDTRATSATVTAHTGASTGVHGITGSVVGTSDAQTLTSKIISGASNTLTVRLANDVSGTLPISSGGTGQTSANAALNGLLPSQTGNGGKVLSTDGSNTSWASAASSTLTAQFTDIGNGSNTRTATNTALLGSIQATTNSQTATVTIAAPGVLTVTTAPATGATVYLTTTGALPTGLTASTTYYAINVTTTTLKLATSLGNALAGTAIATSGTQSGTHTMFTGGLTVGANGLPGNTTGSAIAAGYVGEIIKGNATATNAPAASGLYTNVVVLSLTAGIWDVQGGVVLSIGTMSGLTTQYCAISLTTANTDVATCEALTQIPATTTSFISTPTRRIVLSATQNVFLVAGANYTTVGTANYGTSCFARATRVA